MVELWVLYMKKYLYIYKTETSKESLKAFENYCKELGLKCYLIQNLEDFKMIDVNHRYINFMSSKIFQVI